mmetsp:Transcript_34884/g.84288  ORF Transcript_34884/g.84288 Transcript_34884/m.84288 type:complete len:87 (+) Transcript_34884:903-1163(+)
MVLFLDDSTDKNIVEKLWRRRRIGRGKGDVGTPSFGDRREMGASGNSSFGGGGLGISGTPSPGGIGIGNKAAGGHAFVQRSYSVFV